MPNSPKTGVRSFRVPDDIYFAALNKAREEGTTLSALVTEWIWTYVHEDLEDDDA